MSAIPLKAEIRWVSCGVRFVPKADISRVTRLPPRRGRERWGTGSRAILRTSSDTRGRGRLGSLGSAAMIEG
jgi:hypothetical protein